jgi:excisionase family DNA binding protein
VRADPLTPAPADARADLSRRRTLAGMSAIVSANEAAHHFGLSEKTVRRWIKAGRLKADKSGRAYRVVLSEVGALVVTDTTHDSGPSADTVQTADIGSAPPTTDSRSAMSGIGELVALVDRLQAEARDHAATAAMWQERAGTLADRLTIAETKLLALTAPEQPQNVSGAPDQPAPATDAPVSPLARLQALLPWLLAMLAIVAVAALLAWPR